MKGSRGERSQALTLTFPRGGGEVRASEPRLGGRGRGGRWKKGQVATVEKGEDARRKWGEREGQ